MNNTYNWNNPLMAQQMMQQQSFYQMPAPKYEIIQVKGEAGASNNPFCGGCNNM